MKLPRFLDSWSLGSDQKPLQLVSHHEDYTVGETTGGLSVLFTVLCIVDLFGVFPVVALPKSVVACGKWCTSTYICLPTPGTNYILGHTECVIIK